jgi:hypothetical protein
LALVENAKEEKTGEGINAKAVAFQMVVVVARRLDGKREDAP